MMPIVTELEAGDDRDWFGAHPRRRYRMRRAAAGHWIVRRRGKAAFLRALTTSAIRYPDTDEALRELWFAAAWPALNPLERAELIKHARKGEGQ